MIHFRRLSLNTVYSGLTTHNLTHAAKHDMKSVKNDHVDHDNELGYWLLTSLLLYIIQCWERSLSVHYKFYF